MGNSISKIQIIWSKFVMADCPVIGGLSATCQQPDSASKKILKTYANDLQKS